MYLLSVIFHSSVKKERKESPSSSRRGGEGGKIIYWLYACQFLIRGKEGRLILWHGAGSKKAKEGWLSTREGRGGKSKNPFQERKKREGGGGDCLGRW